MFFLLVCVSRFFLFFFADIHAAELELKRGLMGQMLSNFDDLMKAETAARRAQTRGASRADMLKLIRQVLLAAKEAHTLCQSAHEQLTEMRDLQVQVRPLLQMKGFYGSRDVIFFGKKDEDLRPWAHT